MMKITGLWKQTAKNGGQFLAGNWGNVRVVILPNKYKRNEKDPDFHLLLAEKQNNGQQQGQQQQQQRRKEPITPLTFSDDDFPF